MHCQGPRRVVSENVSAVACISRSRTPGLIRSFMFETRFTPPDADLARVHRYNTCFTALRLSRRQTPHTYIVYESRVANPRQQLYILLLNSGHPAKGLALQRFLVPSEDGRIDASPYTQIMRETSFHRRGICRFRQNSSASSCVRSNDYFR